VLVGDVTATGTLSSNVTATLSNTAVTAGTYGSATEVAQITVDSKGRVTSAANVTITGGGGGGGGERNIVRLSGNAGVASGGYTIFGQTFGSYTILENSSGISISGTAGTGNTNFGISLPAGTYIIKIPILYRESSNSSAGLSMRLFDGANTIITIDQVTTGSRSGPIHYYVFSNVLATVTSASAILLRMGLGNDNDTNQVNTSNFYFEIIKTA
jgi:hypothetical protein